MPTRTVSHLSLILLLLMACGTGATADSRVLAAGYTVAAGDLLEIQVYDQPALTARVRVSADGGIALPLIGRISGLIGQRDLQLADQVAKMLKDGYLPQATVSVLVLELAPRRAHVLGNVIRQGLIDISPYSVITASQGIAECGGFSENADQDAVRLLRPTQEGAYEVVAVPSPTELAKGKQCPPLRPGDLVLVPKLSSITAFVLGRVARPGPVTLPSTEKLTLSKAISLAGGFEKFALRGEVQLLRLGEAARKVDVESFLLGKSTDDPVLRSGDSVYVIESKF